MSQVDSNLYRQVAEQCGEPFAYSYLARADQHERFVTPYTVTAWHRLWESEPAMSLIRKAGLSLNKPQPYHESRPWPPEIKREITT